MTFSSAWIEAAPVGGKPTGSEETIGKLGRPAGSDHYWIPVVEAWAARCGKAVEYVDNSWVRVAATGAELAEFLLNLLSDVAHAAALTKKLDPRGAYVLVAEEF
ncbi:MAG TPA: hypothetical protein VF699_03970 [Caulobacteraceae bacterium]|jgi:hypothetical protein